MLWDIIRDFLVQYIFGGHSSNGSVYTSTLGKVINIESGDYIDANNGDAFIKVVDFYDISERATYNYMTIGDWLSTTVTIISMCLLVVFAVWLVRWIFKAVSSAFLLK